MKIAIRLPGERKEGLVSECWRFNAMSATRAIFMAKTVVEAHYQVYGNLVVYSTGRGLRKIREKSRTTTMSRIKRKSLVN